MKTIDDLIQHHLNNDVVIKKITKTPPGVDGEEFKLEFHREWAKGKEWWDIGEMKPKKPTVYLDRKSMEEWNKAMKEYINHENKDV